MLIDFIGCVSLILRHKYVPGGFFWVGTGKTIVLLIVKVADP